MKTNTCVYMHHWNTVLYTRNCNIATDYAKTNKQKRQRERNTEPLLLELIQGWVPASLWPHSVINLSIHNLDLCVFLFKDALFNKYIVDLLTLKF